ncbi:ESPR-type extended signal peptide-containing protein [Veillonella sp.]
MGLNHIYKVIWSKTKNAWVVVSEIAKRDGKSSVKSVVTSLAGKSVAAVMVAMVMCGGVATANTVYGTGASAYGTAQNVTAIGENATAQNNEVVVVGYNSQAMGATGSIAIGSSAHATSLDTSVAIGAGANTINHGSIAIGGTATSSGTASVAIGNYATSSSTSTTAIGDGSIADKSQATAVGYGSQAKGEDSLAVGTYAAAAGKESVILGSSSGSTKEGSVVVGYHSTGNGKDTIVIGRSAGAYVDNAVVLGSQAGTNYANSVVIGQGSQGMQSYQASTSVNINGINIDSSNFAGTAGNITSGHFVSIGSAGKERQIKNVAAGVISATSTDAVNGSQLYEAVRAVTAGASPDVYMHVNDGTSTQGAGNATTNLGKANEKGGATGNMGIAIGKNATAQGNAAIAIGGYSSYANAENSIAMLGTVDSGAQYGVAIGSGTRVQGSRGTVLGMGASSIGSGATALGSSSYAVGDGSVSLGYYNSAYAKNSVAIGPNTGTENGADNSIAIGYGTSVDYNATNAVAIGGARIGYSATHGSGQIYTGIDNSNSIAIGNGVQVFHKNTVAIGSYDNRTRTSFHGVGSMIPWQTDQNKLITPVLVTNQQMYGGTSNGYIEGTLGNSVYLGHESYAFTPNPLVDDDSHLTGEQSIHTKKYDATGNIVVSNNTTGGAFGKVSKATINGDEITGFAGAQSVGAVTIGAGDYERRIQNVAAGEVSATSTDAINGSQLYAVADTFSKNMSSYMHVNDGTSTQTVGNATTNYGYSGSKAGATGTKSIAGGVNAQAAGEESIALGLGANASGNYTLAQGSGATASALSSIALGQGASVNTSATSSIAIGSNAAVTNYSGVAIGASSRVESVRGTALNGSVSTNSENAVAIGYNSRINRNSNKSISINGLVSDNSPNSLSALGTVTGSHNINIGGGIGYDTYVKPLTSSAGSTIANLSVSNSVAVGSGSNVTSNNTIVIGKSARSYDTANGFIARNSRNASDFISPTKVASSLITTGASQGDVYLDGTLENSVYLGVNSEAITKDSLVDGENSSSGENSIHTKKYDSTGNIVVSNNTTGGAFGKVSKATINGDEITGFAGAQSVGAVTIGAGDYERRIQNVAAGEVSATSTDGINGSQLYAVADTLSKNMSSYMHVNDGSGTQAVGNATTNYGYSGSKAGATGTKSIAGGVNAQATSENGIALGADAVSSGRGAITIGHSAKNESDYNITIGESSTINNNSIDSIAMGRNSTITDSIRSITIGLDNSMTKSASVTGTLEDGIAIGTKNKLLDSSAALSLGTGNKITNSGEALVIGNGGEAKDSKASIVMGVGAKAENALIGVAIGSGAQALNKRTVAIGAGAKAEGEQSISIGTGNEVKGNKSSAIGDPSYIDTTATGTHIQGNDNGTATNPIKASESTFMGNTNLAGTAGTTGIHVVGNSNSVDSSNVMVMGNNVTVGTGLDGAVVLGHASSADQYAAATDSTINGVTFEAAGYAGNTGLNNGSIVSVGATGTERQIKNVAAGAVTATSTDAINGSQLYKTAETILKMPINMAGDSGDTVGLKLGKTVNIKGSVASGADVTDGNIAVVGDKATSTLSLKMAKNLTGLTSGTFTDATGNQTVINGAGVTVTPTGTGATPISITTSGINAGNQEIKGVKKGTTDDAAVNKKQMDDALAGISSTLTINDGATDGSVNLKTGKLKVVGDSGANALVTTTVSGDTITVGTSTKLQNAVTAAEKSADKDLSNLSTTGSDKVKTLAQDAVKVAGTGLATVSDATASGVKTYTVNVDEGKLVIDDTTGKIGAAGASQGTTQGKDGVATTQNVASVVNSAIDKTTKALTDAKHNFAGDDATVISRKHGEQLNIKGGASTTATDLTSGNIAVVGDTTSGTLNIKMAKALTGLTSATYTDGSGNTQTVTGGSSTISDAAGNSTVVSKGGVTTTDGTNTTTVAPSGVTATDGTNTVKLTGSGIDAGNTQIKNVGKATTDDAAVNKKQMDDALKGATDNTVSLGSESGTTTAKKLSTTGGIKFNIKGETGANALISTSATGDDVTIAPTAKLTAAVTAAEKSADKDLSNLSAAGDTYIKNLAKTAASWNVETNGAGTTAVAGGETVNFINGDNIAITNAGRSITIGTAKNVSFDKVTVGGIVLDKNTGINAGNKEIKGVANATSADAAVNKGQMDAAITAAAGGSLSTEKVVAKTLTGDNNLATVTGQTGTAKGETYEVSVSENAVKAVAATAAQDAVKVDGTGLATVSSATAAGVKTYTVNVDEGKLVIDDTTGKVGANGATQGTTQGKNGVATTQDVASVVNSAIDKTTKALTDAKHNFAGDDATVISRKHGEQLNIKGGASTTATDLTSGNIAVVGDTTSGTLNIKMAKALTGLTSATYTDAAGNTQTVTGGSSTISDAAGNSTVVSKGGVTTTDGTNTTTVAPSGVTATDGTNTVKLTGSGIDAGNTQIKNVGKATTDDAAVNKKQMDDALKGATDNTVSLGSESGTTTAKKLSTTGGIKFNIKGETGANALITTSASGDDVTIAPTAKLTAAVTAAEKSADKDLSNLSAAGDTYIKNLAKTAASWNVETNGAGTTAVAGGETVNFINGDNIAITNTGRSITIGTAKNVSFDKVTVGGIVLDKNTGINAGGKEIKGIADGTTADAAVNKGQMDAAITAAAGGSLSTEKVVAKTLTGDNNLATVTGQTGTAKGETYEVSVSENAVKAVAATAAQDAVKVDGTGLATVSSATAAGVKTYTVNVDEGKLVIDDTTGKIGAAGASQGTTQGKNGVATTQDVASVVNSAIDKTKQALDDAKHNFAGDDATVISRKHGEQLNIKGGASTTATDLTSGNIAVVGDTTSGTLNIKLAKVLTGLTSATYTDAAGNTQTVTAGSSTITDGAGNTTTITKGGMTTTDGTNTTTVAPSGVTASDGTNTVKLTGSGIDAGNTQIKNVGKATTDDAAVNKKQMDDAVKAATDSISTLGDNKVSLGSDSGTTTAKKLSTTGGIKFNIKGDTGANALISTSATGDDVTIAPTAKLTAAVTAAEKSADKDLSNISPAGETVIKNLAATSAQDAVKVTGTGLATVTDSTTGGVKTYNVDVKTGNLVVNAAGQAGATGATGAGGAAGADGVATTQNVATAINDAITKSKTDTAQAIADAEHKFDGDTGTTSVRKHGEVLSIKGGVTNTADLATGNIGVVSDGAGTLNIRLAKVLSGLTSASFTNAGGDSTVINGNGVTITPSATGATPISMTTAGINAGNKEIKGVATGTTADAAVNKAQMDAAITAAAGGSLSTEKVVAKTLTGDNNLATVTGQTGTAKGETYEVAVSENAVKAVAQTAAQNAVKVTGTDLATVTDTTTGGVKTYNVDVKTGNLVVNAAGQAGAAGTTGAGGAAGADGVATTQNVATAINDAITKSKTDTAQALANAEHKFDGDTGATSVRKHGEVLSVKGGVTATTDLTTGNIGVVSDGAGTLNIRLAKVLSGLTSATYTDAAGNTQTVTAGSSTITDGAGNTTTITKGGMTTTDGTNTTTVAPSGVTATDGTNTVKLTGSGIDAGNTEIKHVGKATTDDAAVNKKQMDDAVKAATDSISTLGDNKVSLGSDSGTTTAKKLSTAGGIKFNIKGDTGANALISTSATGDDVTIAPTAKLTAAVTAAENSANKDLSNLSPAGNTYIQNLAKSAASWNVETNGAGTTAVSGGDTVNFINGDNIAITNAGRSITIGTARNVSFDKVTVGGVVIDKNNGIDAGGKEITNIGPATSGNSAVNKTQMDTAIANAQTAATSTEKVVAKTLTGDNNLVTVTGQTGTAKGETYEVAVSENAVKSVAQTAAQNAVKVTGTDLATVTDTTTGGVKTYNVDVKTGNLVVTAAGQVGAAGTTGAGGAAGANGVATTQNVATAINDAITKSTANTTQAIANAEHKFDGDTGATSVRKHGEVLSVKGGVTNTADLTTGNIGVVSDGAGTLNIRLAKTLTGLTSAAFTDGTHTVTIAGSGIDAGNTEIKHVGKATTDDAAVNKKQMDDAVKAATDSVTTLGDNKVSLGSDSGTTTAKKLSTTGGIKFNIKGDTGANALITTSATGDDVTIAPTAKLSAAVTAAENSANKDLSNLSTAGNTYIQNLAKSAASWNVETNGAGTTAVSGGDTVNFINGDNIAITNTGRSITIGTARNVSFDKVTVGGVVIDKNNGIDAGGKEITNVGPATSGNSAVNKTQMDTAITNAVNKATTDAKHDFGGDDTTVVTRKHGEKLNIKGGASTTAADLTSGNIAVLGDAATGTLNIRMAKALTGLSSATFTTPSGTTVINGGGMTITPASGSPISVTTGGINAGNTEIKNVAAGTTPNSAVNKQQMDSAISNATANVGFNTAGNTGTGSVTNGQTLTITGTNGIETNASGQSITVGLDAATRAQINNATTTANNAAKKDLSNIDNAGKQVIKDTAAWNVKVNGAAAETVKGGDTVTFNDGDNIKVTNTGKDITIATKKDVSFDKVTVGNVVIDKNTNRISGLANAANNDEAVNLGQMNAAISTATAGTGNIKYKANGGTQNSVALTTGFDFKGDSNIQITADPANSGVINYKLNPALTGITSISGGTGAPTITLNAGSGSTPGNVSINSNLDMGGKQINNIGAATHAGDAVNKAQMDQALQNIAGASSNAAKSYAYKAGAGAAALAALKPIQYDPLEPTQIMAGIGNYKSQTAVALGVAHYTNENTMFNLGVSLDSHDGIVNAGVTHKFGYGPEKKAIPDKYKGGPISSIYVMQDEVTALQAIVQKQAAENEALRQQNEDMQRKVDMILSKIH